MQTFASFGNNIPESEGISFTGAQQYLYTLVHRSPLELGWCDMDFQIDGKSVRLSCVLGTSKRSVVFKQEAAEANPSVIKVCHLLLDSLLQIDAFHF